MIAMTISNSMSVKPDALLWAGYFCMTIPANGKQRDYSITDRRKFNSIYASFVAPIVTHNKQQSKNQVVTTPTLVVLCCGKLPLFAVKGPIFGSDIQP